MTFAFATVIGTNVSPFSIPSNVSTLHGLHSVSLMEAAICVHVCVGGWVGCIRYV